LSSPASEFGSGLSHVPSLELGDRQLVVAGQPPAVLDVAEARINKLRALPTRSVVSAAQRRELLRIEKKGVST
jgi:hypothetical protein